MVVLAPVLETPESKNRKVHVNFDQCNLFWFPQYILAPPAMVAAISRTRIMAEIFVFEQITSV